MIYTQGCAVLQTAYPGLSSYDPFRVFAPLGLMSLDMVKESYNLNQDRFGKMICIRAKIQKKPQRGKGSEGAVRT